MIVYMIAQTRCPWAVSCMEGGDAAACHPLRAPLRCLLGCCVVAGKHVGSYPKSGQGTDPVQNQT